MLVPASPQLRAVPRSPRVLSRCCGHHTREPAHQAPESRSAGEGLPGVYFRILSHPVRCHLCMKQLLVFVC